LTAGQWATSVTKTLTLTSLSMPEPAASRMAFRFSSAWRVCASMPSGISRPPPGLIGSWPATKTKPFETIAWL
jgi:hypothetical protein